MTDAELDALIERAGRYTTRPVEHAPDRPFRPPIIDELVQALRQLRDERDKAIKLEDTAEQRVAELEADVAELRTERDQQKSLANDTRNVDMDEVPKIKDLLQPFNTNSKFDRQSLGAIKLAWYRGKQASDEAALDAIGESLPWREITEFDPGDDRPVIVYSPNEYPRIYSCTNPMVSSPPEWPRYYILFDDKAISAAQEDGDG